MAPPVVGNLIIQHSVAVSTTIHLTKRFFSFIMRPMPIISEYRERHNLTIGDFGQLVGVTYEAVRRWEKGQLRPGAQRAITIEKATEGEIGRHEIRPDLWSREDFRIA